MTFDALTADRIGARWLRGALAPVGDFGRRADDAALPLGPGDEIVAAARCATILDLARRLDADGLDHLRAELRHVPDPQAIVSRATAGEVLDDVDFFEVGRFGDALVATARAWTTAGGDARAAPPELPEIAALLAAGREGPGFYLAEPFDPELGSARAALVAADAACAAERDRLLAALPVALGPSADGEEFLALRDAVPDLPAGVRVVRETPTYRILALEPDALARDAQHAREVALARVGEAEERARGRLSQRVAALGPAMLAATQRLGALDCTLARVAFTQRWGGCVPTFTADRFAFVDGTFVPLRAAREDAGLSYTPISLELRGTAVLTGPNMGGKSAALMTAGFLAACVAAGLPPPAARAEFPLLASVAWIGGESRDGAARLLSAFGAEVVRAQEVLSGARPPALVLVDEFARTTGPREGRALLVALVEALAARGAFALVATHFDGVARGAGVPHLAIAGLGGRRLDPGAARDIAAALDAVAGAMDYRIVPADGAERAHSDALALAALLGLEGGIVERAAEVYGEAEAGGGRAAGE